MKHHYQISGMTCENCAKKIKKTLEADSRIEKVDVRLESKTAEISMKEHLELAALNKILEPLHKYKLSIESAEMKEKVPEKSLKTYWPLILVFLYLILGTSYLCWMKGSFEWTEMMPNFMGLFFLAFAFFKVLDIKGFAESYLSYDIPTKIWHSWGYLYPFIELSLGLAYLFRANMIWTNSATLVVMGMSIIGVIQSVLQKRKIKCVCLGTGFNLPMSTVTIIEDALMIVMAGWMLFINL